MSVAEEGQIRVRAGETLGRVSRYLAGACIEDVNHEIYGGIYSQMLFGEGFQEPAPPLPLRDFTAFGGRWTPKEGELTAAPGEGPKLVCAKPAFASGEVGVEICLPAAGGGNAGLIVKVSQAGLGADRFTGYEISLETGGQLVLGRHRQNWEPLRTVPCVVRPGMWVLLVVSMTEKTLEVMVNGKGVLSYEDAEHPLASGQVGLRTWQREARFRNLWVNTGGGKKEIPFVLATPDPWNDGVSGMWRPLRSGAPQGRFALEVRDAFIGTQSQLIEFAGGAGALGIENQGLNRWGLCFQEGKPYEGCVWANAERAAEVVVALQNREGTRTLADKTLAVPAGGWQRLEFTLQPDAAESQGRFAIYLKKPGAVRLGYAFLQPGAWGRYKDLPCRKDVVEGLLAQGLTVLRYGGSMINHTEYRWKKMIGPRDRRPPHRGTWYPYSTNGWGILDFLNLCEAMGILGIPDFNVDETPRDMADFVEYANGSAESEWGRKRVADGHPEPYRLKYLELGNEEAVNEAYWTRFKPLAQAIWAKDPGIVLIVGDFVYGRPIEDPYRFDGAASRITTLAAHEKILSLANEHDREVWFDIHIGTEHPQALGELRVVPSYVKALEQVSHGARHKVVVFELNAGNHAQRRALANACAINELETLGKRIPIVCSANCLQCDGQNDNGWNQGLLFLNPSRVWPQPPYFVTQMLARNYLPRAVKTEVQGGKGKLNVAAKCSEDGRVLVLQVVNTGAQSASARLRLDDFTPTNPNAHVWELAAGLDEVNTAAEPERIRLRESEWRHEAKGGEASYAFPPYSFTVLRFE